MGGAGMWGFGLLWGLLWLVVLVVVLTAGAYAVASLGGTTGEDPAVEQLRERYARGEIDDEEFEDRADRLSAR